MRILACLFLVGTASALSWQDINSFLQHLHRIWNPTIQDADIEVSTTPNLIELADRMNLTTCVQKMKDVGIHRVINHEGWFTVFCPTNEAFAHQKFIPGEDTLTEKMRFHVARGKYNSTKFQNEAVFRSLLSQRDIRINIYSTKKSTMVTANGQPVVSMDHAARNGYLHVISGVMSSIYDRRGSVISEIEQCCPQNAVLIELFKTAGMFDKLDRANPVTFLAPTNGAFTRLHPKFINEMKRNPGLLREILSAHVIPGTWYTAGLQDGDKFKSWAGNFVTIQKDSSGNIRFSNVQTGMTDISASNGVTHVVDSLIIPKKIKNKVKNILKKLYEDESY